MKQIKPKDRIVTLPIMGRGNTNIIKSFVESLELKCVLPPPTTDETIKKGVRYSPLMMCIPYKITLGNYIEALELGANTLLAYDSKGTCRFRQYNKLHEFTLREIGYDFEMFPVTLLNIIQRFSHLSGKGPLKVFQEFRRHLTMVQNEDNKSQIWSLDKPNIGIIGEIFCSSDEKTNYDLEGKIIKFGGNPYNTARLGDYVSDTIKTQLKRFIPFWNIDEYEKRALKYFNGKLGGHAFQNISNLLKLIDRGVNGIIHILPLSCSPESVIEPYINGICKGSKIPLLRLAIDENSAELNLETRLETFCEMIKWRLKKNEVSIYGN